MYLLITAFGACILILLNEMIFTDILKELNNFYPIILPGNDDLRDKRINMKIFFLHFLLVSI
jgi:hypothetical protein